MDDSKRRDPQPQTIRGSQSIQEPEKGGIGSMAIKAPRWRILEGSTAQAPGESRVMTLEITEEGRHEGHRVRVETTWEGDSYSVRVTCFCGAHARKTRNVYTSHGGDLFAEIVDAFSPPSDAETHIVLDFPEKGKQT